MSRARLTRELIAEGYSHSELAQQQRAGQLHHLRRGAYAAGNLDDPALRHLRLVEATVRLAAPDAVVSHLSAAVVHGLPVFAPFPERVQLTRTGISSGKVRGGIHLHATSLDPSEVLVANGIRVTGLARTVVDVGRTVSFNQAVVTGDAARRRGLSPSEIEECLERSARRPGLTQARRVAGFLDPLSESPGESLSRIVLHTLGIDPAVAQYEVHDLEGRLVGRADFGWEQHRTLGEFDGRVKYGRLLKLGQTAGDVIYAEKVREDALRDLGWQVVRWTYADLKTPDVIADRLSRAFARGHR